VVHYFLIIYLWINVPISLILAVPVSRSRLTSNERTQIDDNVNEKQYLISVDVLESGRVIILLFSTTWFNYFRFGCGYSFRK